jgi:hypothetical protein
MAGGRLSAFPFFETVIDYPTSRGNAAARGVVDRRQLPDSFVELI